MKKYLLFSMTLGCLAMTSNAQTVTFKPGPAIGEDAVVFITDGACILAGNTLPTEDMNFGNNPELDMIDWTYNAIGCPDGTLRSLINFTQLSTIPTSATITSATLRLYGVPSSGTVPGNTFYPGSPYTPGDNRVYVSRVTSPWNESTVTWNLQPTTAAPAIMIPNSATQWNWDYTISSPTLVSIIQDMVTNPTTNYGLQLRLENETNYRSMLFGSSDHPDSTLWPELEVTYTLCDGNFTFCSEANNPYVYDFTAVDPTGTHLWEINGMPVGTAPTLNWTFGIGTWDVCHTYDDSVKGRCVRCFRVCIPQNTIYSMMADPGSKEISEAKTLGKGVVHGQIPQGDLGIYESGKAAMPVARPNPTSNDWDVSLNATEASSATMTLKTIEGRTVFSRTYELEKGQNSVSVPGGQIPAGNYILEINQNNQPLQLRLVKH